VIFLSVHMYMDVNTTKRYGCHVIMIMLPCCYAIMWLCYHDVMMSCGLELNRMIIVNTIMTYVIKLNYVVCCHDVFL